MIKYLILIFVCFSCATQEGNIHADVKSEQHTQTWTPPKLEGHWKLVRFTIVEEIPFLNISHDPNEPQIAQESGPFEYYRTGDLVFEKDSIYQVDYPMEIMARSKFSLDTGYIHYTNGDYSGNSPIEFVNDTLFRYVRGSYGPEYLKEAYIKTNFSDSILHFLKKYRVNYPELAGKWILMREYDFDYGTHYELRFPHTIPDSVEISKEQFLKALDQKNIFWMLTDGKMRDYYFWYDFPYLHLTPGEWYKGEDAWIHFEKR